MINIDKLREANNLEELKKAYRKLALMYHPDKGGTDEQMAEINNVYEDMFKQLNRGDKKTKEVSSEFVEIIDRLMKYEGLEIDIVGTWLWVYGNTYPCKDEIKELGFKWARKKKKWYLGEFTSKRKKGSGMSYEQITNKYGLEKVKKNTQKTIGN